MWASDPTDPRKKEPITKPEISLFSPHLDTWEGNLIVKFTHPVQNNPMCYPYLTVADSVTVEP